MDQKKVLYRLTETKGGGHATLLARQAVERGARKLVAVGGDGTVSEVINGIFQSNVKASDVELGIVASGRGNDAARALGLPRKDVAEAVDVILTGRTRLVDLGWERERCFISVLALGFPVEVARAANRMAWLRGRLLFSAAVATQARRMHAVPLRLELDDRPLDMDCTAVLVLNTPSTGGGLRLAPAARLDDGFLDVVVVGAVGRVELMWGFPGIAFGGGVEHPHFCVFRAKSVKIEASLPLEKMFDGDIQGCAPVEARVLKQVLKVTVPSD